jgi:cytochrome c553
LRIGPPAAAFLAAAGGLLAQPSLAQDDAAARQLAQPCFACHGENGNSANPRYPVLAGQSWRYIYIELKDFQEKRRSDPEMSPMAAPLTRDQQMALANFFAAQKPKPLAYQPDAARAEKGRKVSDATLCPMCHLGEFKGQNEIPRVAGQWPQYVSKQLHAFKARTRTNDAGNMTSVAASLSEDDIENLANYIGTLN